MSNIHRNFRTKTNNKIKKKGNLIISIVKYNWFMEIYVLFGRTFLRTCGGQQQLKNWIRFIVEWLKILRKSTMNLNKKIENKMSQIHTI
jgi:hypothetical protein